MNPHRAFRIVVGGFVSVHLLVGCGGAAGHGAEADGPLPKGQHGQRALVLMEEEKKDETSDESSPGDGTSTPEIVQSVEQDKP